jgi:hypothetical protein
VHLACELRECSKKEAQCSKMSMYDEY